MLSSVPVCSWNLANDTLKWARDVTGAILRILIKVVLEFESKVKVE